MHLVERRGQRVAGDVGRMVHGVRQLWGARRVSARPGCQVRSCRRGLGAALPFGIRAGMNGSRGEYDGRCCRETRAGLKVVVGLGDQGGDGLGRAEPDAGKEGRERDDGQHEDCHHGTSAAQPGCR